MNLPKAFLRKVKLDASNASLIAVLLLLGVAVSSPTLMAQLYFPEQSECRIVGAECSARGVRSITRTRRQPGTHQPPGPPSCGGCRNPLARRGVGRAIWHAWGAPPGVPEFPAPPGLPGIRRHGLFESCGKRRIGG